MEVGEISKTPACFVICILTLTAFVDCADSSKISNERLCGNKECTVIISEAKTLGTYGSKDPFHLTFKRGQIIQIYSKSAGDKPELWGGEIDGKRGYFPKTFVREMNVHIHNPNFKIATEISDDRYNVKHPVNGNVGHDQDPVKRMEQSDFIKDAAEQEDKKEEDIGAESEVIDVDDSTITKMTDINVGTELDDTDVDETDVDKTEDKSKIDETDFKDNTDVKDDDEVTHLEDMQNDKVMDGGKDLKDSTDMDDVKDFKDETDVDDDKVLKDETDVNDVKDLKDETDVDDVKDLKDETDVEDDKVVKDETDVFDDKEDDDDDDDDVDVDDDDDDDDEKDITDETDVDDTDLKFDTGVEESLSVKDGREGVESDKENTEEGPQKPVIIGTSPDDSESVKKDSAEETQSISEVNPPDLMTDIDDTDIDETEFEEEEAIKPELTGVTDKPSDVDINYDELRAQATEKEINELHQRRLQQKAIVEGANSAKDEIDALNALLTSKKPPVVKPDLPKDKNEPSKPETSAEAELVPNEPQEGNVTGGQGEAGEDTVEYASPRVVTPKDTLDPVVNDSDEDTEVPKGEILPIEPDLSDTGDTAEPQTKEELLDDHHVVKLETIVGSPSEDEDSTASSIINEAEKPLDDSVTTTESISPSATQEINGQSAVTTPLPSLDRTSLEDSTAEKVSDIEATPSIPHSLSSTVLQETLPLQESELVQSSEMSPLPSESDVQMGGTVTEALTGSQEPASAPVGNYEVFEGTTIYHDEEPVTETPFPDVHVSAATDTVTASVEEVKSGSGLPLVRDILKDAEIQATKTRDADDAQQTTTVNSVAEQLSHSEVLVTANSSSETPERELSPVPNADAYHTLDFMTRKPLSEESFQPTPRVHEETAKSEIPVTKQEEDKSHREGQNSVEEPQVDSEKKDEDEESHHPEDSSETGLNKAEDNQLQDAKTNENSINEGDSTTPQPEAGVTEEQRQEPAEGVTPPSSESDTSESEQIAEPISPPPKESSTIEQETVTETPGDYEEPNPVEVTPAVTTPPSQEVLDTIVSDELKHTDHKADDPYASDDHWSRRIIDAKMEEEMYSSSFQAFSKQFMSVVQPCLQWILLKMPSSIQIVLEKEPLGLPPPIMVLATIVTLLVMLTVTCCSCMCGGSRKRGKKTNPLVVVRGLEEKLFIATKEKENMEDELVELKKKVKALEKQVITQQKTSGASQVEVQNLKLHNNALKETVGSLQAEVESYKETFNQAEVSLQDKQTEIERLQKNIVEWEAHAASIDGKHQEALKELGGHRSETDNLTTQMEALNEQVQFLETRKHQLTIEADEWEKKVKELTDTLSQTQDELKAVEENMTFKENELEVLRDCFVQLKAFEEEKPEDNPTGNSKSLEEKLRDMMDVSRVNATLKSAEEEMESLKNKLYIETDARKEMEDQIESLKKEVDNLSLDKSKAERSGQDATTKLHVLTTYFKEKEVELQKELGEQQTLKKQSASQLMSADEKTRDMELELTTLRERVKDLSNEITSAERDFRAQIASNEKKAHENWLAARASDREAREARHESSILRQKLMDLERRQAVGLIRPLPTRGMPPPGLPNGPPPPLPPMGDRPPFPPDRPLSRSSVPSMRDDDLRGSPRQIRYPPPPMDRRPFPPGMPPPPGMRMPPPPRDMRSPPSDLHSPPPYDRRPPPRDLRSPLRDSPPPFDRRPPPPMSSRSPPYRPEFPPPPHMRGGPPPPRMGQGSPTSRGDPDRQGPRGNSPYDGPGRDRPPRQHSQV